MADTAIYRIWQSPDGVLIQHKSGWMMELSVEEALAFAADLNARLAPPPAPRGFNKWTPELIAEAARLYQEEGLGHVRIARRLGLAAGSLHHYLKKAGVTSRTDDTRNQNLALGRAARNQKLALGRAARAAKGKAA